MEKVCYIVSDINKSLAFEWIATNIDKEKYDLYFILIGGNDTMLEDFLKKFKIACYSFSLFPKFGLLTAFFKVLFLLIKIRPHVVHCHLLKANLVGLLASTLLLVPKRIYTRHHSTFHHTYSPRGIKLDKISNFLSTHIIAVSNNVKQVLIEKERVPERKIYVVPHGFDLHAFEVVKEVEVIREKHFGDRRPFPIIGVVARYIEWKGIQFIISAFQQLLEEFPHAHLLLANAAGPDQALIESHLVKLPTSSFTEITFEENIAALYHIMDIYVHVPVDPYIEAFGQTYVEALSAGTPSVFTLSGIAKEFIQHEKNALVVDYEDAEEIRNAVVRLLYDKELQIQITTKGRVSVQDFSLEQFISKLEALYSKENKLNIPSQLQLIG